MAKEFLPFRSLDAVATTGAGSARDLEGVFRQHTMSVVASGVTNSFTIKIEGSHDNVNWFELGNAVPSGGGTVVSMVTAGTHLVRYVRANITNISGSVTAVTASIATGAE